MIKATSVALVFTFDINREPPGGSPIRIKRGNDIEHRRTHNDALHTAKRYAGFSEYNSSL